jgi:hypothetical protein
MVVAGVALAVVVVAVSVTFARAGPRLGWVQFAAWLHAALVVGVTTVDAGKKIGYSKPDLGGSVGWGLWLACAGVTVGLVGLLIVNRAEGDTVD